MEKRIEDLNLEDDFLFSRVMSDEEICRIVLEKILNISIKQIVLPEQQKTIDLLLDSKGVRLDIYVNDDVGTIYNCEMQRGKRGQLPKRSRYYQGNIDLDSISKGEPYTSLRRSYIITSVPLIHLQKAGTSTPFRTPASRVPDCFWEMRQQNCFLIQREPLTT